MNKEFFCIENSFMIYFIICWIVFFIWFNHGTIKDRRNDVDWTLSVILSPVISCFAFIILPFFLMLMIMYGISVLLEYIVEVDYSKFNIFKNKK